MKDSTTYRARTNYNERKAAHYQQRKSHKHAVEMKLVDRAFRLIPKTHSVLDIPCGGGRVFLRLAKQGYMVAAADLSDAMLEYARENANQAGLDCPVEKKDIEQLDYPEKSFDTVICFRLFQHFPTGPVRQRAVSEMCRVAGQYVVMSYFSPYSWTQARLLLLEKIAGKKRLKFPTSLREVESYFANNGYRLVKDFCLLPLVQTLHLAVFERIPEP
jgi:2-polyprenyl-3-methyl-5-hydroxy-6-metoxy-1,4-benzoquinol methylase